MANKTKNSNKNNSQKMSSDNSSDNLMKSLENYSIIVLFFLIAAILFLSFELRLLAGIMIIAGASIGLIVIRKISYLNQKNKESIDIINTLNENKDSVIIDFSHRIREPLNNLVIIFDMLIESGLDNKQKELLETCIASTNNMVTTVNDLTMQSAGNLGYETRKHIRFNPFSTVQHTIELYNLKDRANIEFTFNKHEFIDFECFGDPIILKQIFIALFNTIEYQVGDRATKVTINLKKDREEGTKSIISLRIKTDHSIILINDIGADKSMTARLISSGDGTFTQEFGEDYTILNILLAFNSLVAETKQTTASPKIEELKQKDKGRKELKDLKVLLVEDNLINQKITLLTLKPLVNSIDTASNGKEALDKFGTSNYDLILMDIQMPVMNGLVATEKIRALESSTNSHVHIIAITANAMIGDKEKCLSAGIDDYISKPFQPAAFIEAIKKNI